MHPRKRPGKPGPKPVEQPQRQTHWGDVAEWYDQLVGEEGSDYQKHVVFPGVLKLLDAPPASAVLDVACGQGVFCRILHERGYRVTGVDAAPELIRFARERNGTLSDDPTPKPAYHIADARALKFLPEAGFTAATCILAIQNIDQLQPVFEGVARALTSTGQFILVMMHPAFRGPKFATWGWDEQHKVQYRRVDRYLLPRKEPIFTHPGQKTGQYTWTFHRPVAMYVKALRSAGFLVEALDEWASHKTSTSGPRVGAENQARKEIPLFMAIKAVKVRRGGGETSPVRSPE